MAIVALLAMAAPAFAADSSALQLKNWLGFDTLLAEGDAEAETPEAGEPVEGPPPHKSPPLPFHSIEGYSGGAITPFAYMCHPGPKGCISSLPSVATTYVNMGSKKLLAFSVTQVLFNRIEFGYALNHLDVGSLYDDVRKAQLDMGRDHVNLHHFNLRFLFVEENSFDLPLPAITGGIHFKYNDSIERIDRSLGGAFTNIGYENRCGIDYTLTMTKMFPELVFGRPLILTGGMRLSNAAQLGFFGFGNEYNLTFEGSVVYLPIDEVCLGYEFRMKNNPYHKIDGLIGEEDNWHAFSASWIVNDRLTITGVYGMFGEIGNARADCSLGIELKYEF
jgi:hypothetical protein